MQKATGLEYEEHGQGEPLLLIHGAFIADALSLLARESALTDRYRVIWYRRPGYGGSDPVAPPFSMADQAACARGLLEHLGVEKAHIVGHSGGGVIATALACLEPGLTQSLTVLEPAILPPALAEAFPEMLGPAIEVYRSGDPGGGVDAFMNLIGSDPNWREQLARVLPNGPAQANRDAHVTFDIDLTEINSWSLDSERASLLSSPVCFMVGTESGPLIETTVSHFQSAVPKAEVVRLEGLDHSMCTEGPAQVAKAIAEFIGRQH